MKALKSVKKLSLVVSLIFTTSIYSSAIAQEYDDMYFNKTDRKTVKIEKTTLLTSNNKNNSYKEITKSTETFSAKNVNPEYIARYKSTESNQVNEQTVQKSDSYSSNDYFVEGYDKSAYVSDSKNSEIDYAALNKRDQMSSKKNYGSLSNSAMRFSPYMAMGFGSAYGRYGYDPFTMGYGSGMSMGFGSGFGYSPYMSFNVGMSWGSGYNPWGSFYNPYRMRGYDPWRSMYGYNPYGGLGGYSPYYGSGYGGYCPTFTNSYSNNYASEYNNGRNIQYKPRTTRVNSTINTPLSNNENLRTSSSNSKIRVPNRTTSATRSDGRIGNDYSKGQNEYYNKVRRSSSSSARRISSNNSTRNTYSRNSNSVSRSKSSINNNKPSRVSNYSSGYNRNNSSSKSYSSPSRSSSSSNYSGRSTNSGSSYRSTGSSSSSSSSRSSSSGAVRSGRR